MHRCENAAKSFQDSGGKAISRAGQKYLLDKLIRNFDDSESARVFTNIRDDLFKLYEVLMLNDITGLDSPDETEKEHGSVESDAISLYNQFTERLSQYGLSIDKIKLNESFAASPSEEVECNTALDYLRSIYPKVYTPPNEGIKLSDGSLELTAPFPNKEAEIEYIAKRISDYLAPLHGDITALHSALTTDIAIALPDNQGRIKYAHIINTALKKSGFNSVRVLAPPRSIRSYPAWQYVSGIYSLATSGMSVRGFKQVLYSNPGYSDGEKWDSYIGEFSSVKMFFEGKVKVEEWIAEINSIQELKKKIDADSLYKFHPIVKIKNSSLEFLYKLAQEIKQTLETIDITATVDVHIKMLRDAVMSAAKMPSEADQESQKEQLTIHRLCNVLAGFHESPMLGEMDAADFFRYLMNRLDDYEAEHEANTESTLALIGPQNTKKYKQVFLMGAENDAHRYRQAFPFSENITKILPASVLSQLNHCRKQHLKNVLSFTTEKLVITCTSSGTKFTHSPIYDEVRTAFDVDFNELLIDSGNTYENPDSKPFVNPAPYIHLKSKPGYDLHELATFKLCPKLYFHKHSGAGVSYRNSFQLKHYFQAVLFADLMDKFVEYNERTKKTYLVASDECLNVLSDLLERLFDRHMPAFSSFSSTEMEDIKFAVHNKLESFIRYEVAKKNKSGTFTVLRKQPKKWRGNGYDLALCYDINIKHGDFDRLQQSDFWTHYLVSRTNYSKKAIPKHYADIIEELAAGNPQSDRIRLTSRIIQKINIQFGSGSAKFAKDGLVRTNALVEEIRSYNFAEAKAAVSGYCIYCPVRDICRERDVVKVFSRRRGNERES